jgi:hypothetical protein
MFPASARSSRGVHLKMPCGSPPDEHHVFRLSLLFIALDQFPITALSILCITLSAYHPLSLIHQAFDRILMQWAPMVAVLPQF